MRAGMVVTERMERAAYRLHAHIAEAISMRG